MHSQTILLSINNVLIIYGLTGMLPLTILKAGYDNESIDLFTLLLIVLVTVNTYPVLNMLIIH
jgi:hypothetical protein